MTQNNALYHLDDPLGPPVVHCNPSQTLSPTYFLCNPEQHLDSTYAINTTNVSNANDSTIIIIIIIIIPSPQLESVGRTVRCGSWTMSSSPRT